MIASDRDPSKQEGMWGIDSSIVLVLIPIVFVGIIVVAVIGSQDERTRGDKLSKFFSIASNAALFFTVLALLYQVIDSQEDAKQAAYSELLDTFYRIDQMQTDHPEIFAVIYPGEEYNRIGDDEKLARQYTYAVLSFFERVYVMHRDDVIEDQMWNGWQNWITYAFTTGEYFQMAWDVNCGVYHPDFVAFIEENYRDGTCSAEVGGQPGDSAGTPAVAPVR